MMENAAGSGSTPGKLPYRDELDGMRAIAVVAVLCYHAGYNDWAGGFVGVDIFLVLSGYLITQQVVALQTQGAFRLGPFWLRRARRLIPAMVPVLVLATISALILKGDASFREYLGHALSSAAFVSNYLYLSQADYFSLASDTNLLLHTWSLSLEMQFYLAMPVVLILLGRAKATVRIAALVLLAAASLAFAEFLIRTGSGSWAFFGILPRFWEFALGGVVACLPRVPALFPGLGAVMRGVGITAILWLVYAYSGGPFPGLGAAVPVLGTALVLLAPATGRDPVRWLLESRGMRWMGLRSYAIYLVHWPLFVSVTPSAMNRSEGILTAALLASIVLGHLIYRYVERPVRESERFSVLPVLRKGLFGYAVGTVAVLAVLATPLGGSLRAVLPLQPLRSAVVEIETQRDAYFEVIERLYLSASGGAGPSVYCTYDNIAGLDEMMACLSSAPADAILVIGDSHGRDTLLALEQAFPGQSFVMLHQSSCSAARYFDRAWCFEHMPELFEGLAAQDRLDRVILTSRWGYGTHVHASEGLADLQRLGAAVVVLGPGPTFSRHVEQMIVSAAFQGNDLADTAFVPFGALAFDVLAVDRELADMASAHGAGYMNRVDAFCSTERCRVYSRHGTGYLFWDNQHLTNAAITELAEDLRADPVVSALVRNP